ncbi:hypothetical protein [Shivajiella indica]|uniref:Uncharacterized protein n=1 Tax=Shivajiella indica TaxID=872115 RepID=A0ABW5B600_9BACT
MNYRFYLVFTLVFFLSGKTFIGFAFQDSPLFSSEKPLELELVTSLEELKLSKSDTVFFSTLLRYLTEEGEWDSLEVSLRARGNSRREKCQFPPIRMKIKKKDSNHTIFREDKALKLVIPCQYSFAFNDLIMKEYVCYKFYESVTPYHFKTRLVNLTLTDNKNRKSKTYNLKAFIIEDDDNLAKRFDAKISKAKLTLPNAINDTLSLQQDFFAFMIGNTDWSNTSQHNVKIMDIKGGKKVPVPYDFDLSGFVNAPYALPYDYLPIKSVTERLYRGICRESDLIQYVKNQFLMNEQIFTETLNSFQKEISSNDFKIAKNYLNSFFDILKNDREFNNQIIAKCTPYNIQ